MTPMAVGAFDWGFTKFDFISGDGGGAMGIFEGSMPGGRLAMMTEIAERRGVFLPRYRRRLELQAEDERHTSSYNNSEEKTGCRETEKIIM